MMCVTALKALWWRSARVHLSLIYSRPLITIGKNIHLLRTQLIKFLVQIFPFAVPCVPQHVTAEMVCSNDTGVVSWEEGEGVTSYQVLAYGPDGHKTECHSSESSCELLNMHCGQLYNVTITAQDGRCDNSNAFLNLMSGKYQQSSV